MCNLPEYINKAIGRINEFFPEPVAVTELRPDVFNKLPFGLSGAYDLYEIEVMGRSFILGGIDENAEVFPPNVLAKQRDVFQKFTGLTPIFVFDKVASYNFPRYTRKNLNIIVGDRQVFLPSVFLIAGKETPVSVEADTRVPVFFQLLVLYHLQKEKVNGMTMRILSNKLKVSYATVNRGIRWMHTNGFISLSASKEKQIEFLLEGKQLWEKAVKYLDSPIEFIAYTPELVITDKSLISEQNALAEYTLLNGGPYRIAISKEVYQEIKNQVHWDQFGEAGVEVWKYDPRLLSENNTVDRLSLYLMLKDYEDERVQIELENMMNEIVW